MRIALIDGDEIAYKVALQFQDTIHVVSRDNERKGAYPSKALAIESIAGDESLDITPEVVVKDLVDEDRIIDEYISTILLNTNCTDINLFLSGENNFRYEMATLLPYKGNREGGNKPFHLKTIKDKLRDRGATSIDFLEADDMMSSTNSLSSDECVICSTDKDLRTVPSWNYNISTKLYQEITEEQALYNFYMQLLIGDPVDNIPSPYKLGEVTAGKILSGIDTKTPLGYYRGILKEYFKYLTAKDRDGEFRTKWYNPKIGIHDILYEVGNLLWMRRTLNPEERWDILMMYKNG
jgi:hypothetical protein